MALSGCVSSPFERQGWATSSRLSIPDASDFFDNSVHSRYLLPSKLIGRIVFIGGKSLFRVPERFQDEIQLVGGQLIRHHILQAGTNLLYLIQEFVATLAIFLLADVATVKESL
jgi:hypothetical protein